MTTGEVIPDIYYREIILNCLSPALYPFVPLGNETSKGVREISDVPVAS
jgi:hypothetical protein